MDGRRVARDRRRILRVSLSQRQEDRWSPGSVPSCRVEEDLLRSWYRFGRCAPTPIPLCCRSSRCGNSRFAAPRTTGLAAHSAQVAESARVLLKDLAGGWSIELLQRFDQRAWLTKKRIRRHRGT